MIQAILPDRCADDDQGKEGTGRREKRVKINDENLETKKKKKREKECNNTKTNIRQLV